MSWIDTATAIIKATVPRREMDEAHTFNWRRNLYLSLLITFVVLVFHILFVSGEFAKWGFSGVAMAEDVERQIQDAVRPLQTTINQTASGTKLVLRAIYATQIRQKVRERCDSNDPGVRERINQQLDRILKEYKDATGEDFQPMPTCDEV